MRKNKPSPAEERRPEFPGIMVGLILFGLVFLFAGLLPLSLDVQWWNAIATSSWNAAPATLSQTEGQLLYTYEWRGARHMQSTYSFDDGDGEILSGRKQTYAAARKPGEAVTAYVNPTDPGEAVLNRSLNWEDADLEFDLSFVAIFGIIGLLSVFFGSRHLFAYAREVRAFRARRSRR